MCFRAGPTYASSGKHRLSVTEWCRRQGTREKFCGMGNVMNMSDPCSDVQFEIPQALT